MYRLNLQAFLYCSVVINTHELIIRQSLRIPLFYICNMLKLEDNFKHQGLRRKLVNTLREKGISNESVLTAIDHLPRHYFLDETFLKQAYSNMAFQIGAGQTISHPYTVAFQSSLLEIKKGDKVLEIGTGCGYQTAILMILGAKVFSVERQRSLFDKTKVFLPKIGYKPKLFYGDGYAGKEAFAPFDSIIVTCGAPFIPDALIQQLKIGGKLVIPVGDGSVQEMKRLIKQEDGSVVEESYGEFSFVPMLQERE